MRNLDRSVTSWKSKIKTISLLIGIIAFILLFIRALGYRADFYRCEKNYENLRKDWEGRNFYKDKKPNFKPDVVFIGASNIEHWNLERFFPELKVVNRGIGEQISAQMLLRFYQDVVELSPKIVVITAGSNDIKNRVPIEFTVEYITRMINIAKAHSIKVVLTTVTPVNDTQKGMLKLRPLTLIKRLNDEIRKLAEKLNVELCDFWKILSDKDGYMPKEYSYDGVHLNEKGYELVSKALKPILLRLLNEKG